MHLGDLTLMSDSGAYKGRSYDIVVSCYLIKHGDDWLLWDTGLSKDFLGGVTSGSLKMELTTTLVEQLEALGLSPSDIDIVALSHAHFDHAGQTGDFPEATLVLQRSEYQVLLQEKVQGAFHRARAAAEPCIRSRAEQGQVGRRQSRPVWGWSGEDDRIAGAYPRPHGTGADPA